MIDLHAHSFCSDGTQSPVELMASARQAGLTAVGLTDHDTIAGWDEAADAVPETGVSLVRGMEVTSTFHDADSSISVHMLAYLFDPHSPALAAHRDAFGQSRARRAQETVSRLAEDFPISWEEVAAFAGAAKSVGRPHIADALVARGIVENRSQAFDHLLHSTSKYYVKNYSPDVFDVIEWINDAGGRAVLAHPLAVTRGKTVPLEAIAAMAEAGLFGVEVNHRDNPAQLRAQLSARARSAGLFEFGSSDYHGSGKPNRLGENTTDSETLIALEQGAFLEVVHP
ncbi:PHP domain-containing protein [Trueperella pecoris]|uniref:PHP domain-containing protein n=1 Tax=Trueperella pecoris TaxID=2733571 RepID=A0A7M1QSL7_9ACTO|nr:PHP domain-containing protein [Trueperella pecoris]QOR45009.1 PHP domain-containing protein [Trueperella pecoris]QTG74909.1 PHP domain-containing protein [Trueperella pecoris]